MIKRILFIMLIALSAARTSAQVEGTMPFMKSLPQVSYYNPAVTPAYKFSFGLPGSSVFFSYSNNGFSYNDMVTRSNNAATADLDKFYNALRPENYITTNVHADVFRFSLKAGARMYLTSNVTAKVYNRLMLPRDLTGILIKGTSEFVNSTASISPKVETMGYMEVGFGSSYVVNKKLTVGAKLKVLKGIANVTTQKAEVNLSLAENYAMTITADGDFRTSGVHNFIGEEDEEEYDIEENWRDYTKNTGFAFDIGASYKVTDRLTTGFSLIDIGGITWKNDTYGYRVDPARARFTFEGIDLNAMMDGDEDYMNSLADSLAENFEPEEGEIAAYRTPLPMSAYATLTYNIKKTFSVGALAFAERFRGRLMPGFTASLNKEFGRRIGTSLSYTITNNSFNNIGAGLSINIAPVQLYLVADNILRAPLILASDKNLNGYVNSLQYFNMRLGLNFIFGRDKVQEKQPVPAK